MKHKPNICSVRRLGRTKPLSKEDIKFRSEWDRDLGRILHSSSFRRLQGKTQIWGMSESDFFRTRLTHSVEAGQIGMTLAEALRGLDGKPIFEKTMVMACCLAHDIGHPPLGHDGQGILDHFAQKLSGGKIRFSDNAQNLRILLSIENLYDGHYGLDLTASTLDGMIKYKELNKGYYPEEAEQLKTIVKETGTSLKRRHPVAMLVELADDIAYACHDLEDALRSGLICIADFAGDRAAALVTEAVGKRKNLKRTANKFLSEIRSCLDGKKWKRDYYGEKYRDLVPSELNQIWHKRLKSHLVDRFIRAAVDSFENFRTEFVNIDYADGTTNLFLQNAPALDLEIRILKKLVRRRVIDAQRVQFRRLSSRHMMEQYLGRYESLFLGDLDEESNEFLSLPVAVQHRMKTSRSTNGRLRVFLDYVAGMTDNFLYQQAESLFRPYEVRAFKD